jgi:23S rRNA pseudoU1915 N3-methylase RlmH
VIGGPYGFSDTVYSKAQGKISLSLMTSPNGTLVLLSSCIALYYFEERALSSPVRVTSEQF